MELAATRIGMKETLTRLQEDTLTTIMERRKNNPITGKEVASAIGLKPRATGKEGADLRSIVNALRCKGYPICASNDGYYWPGNDADLTAYLDIFQGRINDQAKALAGMRFGFDKILPTAVKSAIEASKVYYYEVEVEGVKKCMEVVGNRLGEFLALYPLAKKV